MSCSPRIHNQPLAGDQGDESGARSHRLPRIAIGFCSLFCSLLLCEVLTAGPQVDFRRDVLPILSEHCFHCHGADAETREASLRFDVRSAATAKLESGNTAIVPGKPEESVLISRVQSNDPHLIMPPRAMKKQLSTTQVSVLSQWIADGAPYAEHWAFIPPVSAKIPEGQNPIDVLVESHHRAMGKKFSPTADAATLCRRLFLDIVGLPPQPEQLTKFVEKYGQQPSIAVAELIEELLHSPSYGEKWARHWLDAARYSDSNGYEKDLPREQWAWRDWVISAFQRDLPYDQFITEQLAGDLLPGATQDQIVATGFLRNSMVNEEGAIVPEQFRMDEMFDRMDCIGKSILGLTLQCAQCHTHKFDPISHDEYYGLFAFLNSTYEAQSWVYTPEQLQTIAAIKQQLAAADERWKTQRPNWQKLLAEWEQQISAREVEWAPLQAKELASSTGLNHPTQNPDGTIMVQGHPTTKGEIFGIFSGDFSALTGLRLEALTHGDLPFLGPGRSKFGTWAVSELTVWKRASDAMEWTQIPLTGATADFSEPAGRLEDEWKANFDPEGKRSRGPVEFLIDRDPLTGWRADRGVGQRNQPGVAVVQFDETVQLPEGSQLKVSLLFDHGGSDSGRHSTQLGCFRLSVTKTPQPTAQAVDYSAILALRVPSGQRTEAEKQAIFNAWANTFTDEPTKQRIAQRKTQWQRYPMASTSVLHLSERSTDHRRVTSLLDRGAWDRPKHAVQPQVLSALHDWPEGSTPNRLGLASWLVSRESPLMARVAVNRVWQAIFGTGLVTTPEDFGTRSPAPEMQDVLDSLAVDFMAHGGSHRHLIRTILSSRTYQQASHAPPEAWEQDPENRQLARGPRFRLEAEVLRDSALQIAGLLDVRRVGGPSIFPPVPASVLEYNYFKPTYWEPPTGPERYRRALYVFRKRSMPDPALSSFDAPNGDSSCVRRARSNAPLSALTSLNEQIFVEAAQAMAQRVWKEGGDTDSSRIAWAWKLCVARAISDSDLARIDRLLNEQRARLRRREIPANSIAFSSLTRAEQLPVDATPIDIAAWTIVCRVLLNLDETLTKF